ncbi:uncharacterized protein RHIMIDRAFT_295608 [Rhizopus microsporus ATCC 52813]|uniref:Uncharacterized protein n=1 Tax=Rhizopus microsporus ATCC 52813 TaxID=1340429 RepID=A0A2G4SHL4_RHIZD|nr:uncharacterized protein RHIMIDRAFT_295608 [Rhizopus microsporus ATCC 52813]PHZ07876.1 hypothetical protein RHIMIDRAFT_295608 [Rhizopus microsporus ATCC 52813]
MVQEQEKRYQGSEFLLATLQTLDKIPSTQLKGNFKSYKRTRHGQIRQKRRDCKPKKVQKCTSNFNISAPEQHSAHPQTKISLPTHLNKQNDLQFLDLQDTSAEDESTQSTLNILFNSRSAFWTSHCGEMCLNLSITVAPIPVTVDQRLIICEISHTRRMFEPFTLVNPYAPPQHAQNRIFFESLLSLSPFSSFSTD